MTTALRIEFPPGVMTKPVAAYYLGMSEREIDRLRAEKKLIAVSDEHHPKLVKFLKEELDRYRLSLTERDTK